LLPSLSRSRARAQAVVCRSNVRGIGTGLVLYSSSNRDYAVPSYNLPWNGSAATNFTGGPNQPLDGWGPILDRDKFVPTTQRDTNSTFFCPNTVNVEGMKDGQTGTDPDKPRGWTDWPLRFTSVGGDSAPKEAITIPERGFRKIIRVSYWINAYNPVGNQPADIAALDLHYTASVGLGPDGKGQFIKPHRVALFRPSPSLFIVAADGIYMGRQGVTRQGDANSRIGYRHPGNVASIGVSNVIFADGHVDPIAGNKFPRAISSSDSAELLAEKRRENLSGPTIYSNPKLVFP
jgi:prepilin-type processing-associated H-X9-DG protein